MKVRFKVLVSRLTSPLRTHADTRYLYIKSRDKTSGVHSIIHKVGQEVVRVLCIATNTSTSGSTWTPPRSGAFQHRPFRMFGWSFFAEQFQLLPFDLGCDPSAAHMKSSGGSRPSQAGPSDSSNCGLFDNQSSLRRKMHLTTHVPACEDISFFSSLYVTSRLSLSLCP